MKAEEFLEELKKGSAKGSMLAAVANDEVTQGKTYCGYRFFYNSCKGDALYWHNLISDVTRREHDLGPEQARYFLGRSTWTAHFWQAVVRRAVHYHLDTEEVSALILLVPQLTGSCVIKEALGIKAVD